MNTASILGISCMASYLLGAVPFGFIFAKAKGVDIRTVGSKNIGATNVFRSVSKALGITTFICDVLKGFVATFLFPIIAVEFLAGVGGHLPDNAANAGQILPVLCACFAVAGHNWPVYLKFKGGKGVATSAGALLGIAPLPLGIGLAVWIVVFALSRYVSLASITAALTIPAAGWILVFVHSPLIPRGYLIPTLLTILGLASVWRHKANIKRLLEGTENRFVSKK